MDAEEQREKSRCQSLVEPIRASHVCLVTALFHCLKVLRATTVNIIQCVDPLTPSLIA
jgi:hypothetical protein